MKNNVKIKNAVLIVLSVLNLIVSVIYVFNLPKTVPVHFNMNWECDSIGSRWVGLVVPFICMLMVPFMNWSAKNMKNADDNKKPMNIIGTVITGFLIVLNWFVLSVMGSGAAIGERIDGFEWVLILAFGVLFVVLGNYMPTVRQNDMLGIRIPCTLNNEKCWNATHRFSGKLYVVFGLLSIIAAFVLKNTNVEETMIYVLPLLMIIMFTVVGIIPIIYAVKHKND